MSDENDEKKDIEVVNGIGNLDISPVYENLTVVKPQMQDEKPKEIVIPQVKKPVETKANDTNNVHEDEKISQIDDDIDDADEDDLEGLDDFISLLDSDDDADLDDDIEDIDD